MNTISQSKISFGQLVPTEALLKSALRVHNFDDAKVLNNSVGIVYSGHIGFYKKAITIAENVLAKNPELKAIVTKLKSENAPDRQMKAIKSAISQIGDNIDVIV